MNARHHLSLARFPEGNAKRPNGDSRSAFWQTYIASLLKLGVVGDAIWFATSYLQWWYHVALLWQHLFCNGHLHVSITVKNTDGVDRDHLMKKSFFVYRFFG